MHLAWGYPSTPLRLMLFACSSVLGMTGGRLSEGQFIKIPNIKEYFLRRQLHITCIVI